MTAQIINIDLLRQAAEGKNNEREIVESLRDMAEAYVNHYALVLNTYSGDVAVSANATVNALARDAITRAKRCHELWDAQLKYAEGVLLHMNGPNKGDAA